MKIELKFINKFIYNKMDAVVLFNSEHSRCYGILTNGEYSFKFGWQSNIVEPKVVKIKENIYAVGIDLNFAMTEFNSRKILFNIELEYFFYDIKIHDGFIYVISELEILVISQKSFRIMEKFQLTDFFKEITFKEELTEIITIDGNTMTFRSVIYR